VGAEIRKCDMRDPAEVLERKQEGAARRSCAGCREIRVVEDPFGIRRLKCKKGNEVGQRCRDFQERTSE